MTLSVRSSTSTVTVLAISRFGTEYRPERNRMQESLSTFLVVGLAPNSAQRRQSIEQFSFGLKPDGGDAQISE